MRDYAKGGIGPPPGERKWSLRGIGDLGFEDYSNLLAAERRREHGHADEIVLRRASFISLCMVPVRFVASNM